MGGKKRCNWNERWIYAADSNFRRRTCQHRHLPRAFETAGGPLGTEGRSLTENTPIGRFSAGLPCPNHFAAVGGILVFSGLAPYSPYLNSLDFSFSRVLHVKGTLARDFLLLFLFIKSTNLVP